ncbi:MAG: hypothetical protein NT144_14610 [Bacteroidia bacterium]|nr:hypothetical protein [Bacteroidia bacterium]
MGSSRYVNAGYAAMAKDMDTEIGKVQRSREALILPGGRSHNRG